MKSKIKAFAALSLASIMIMLAGCSGESNNSQPTSELVTHDATQKPTATTSVPTTDAQTTEKLTEVVTEKPAEPTTEAPKEKEYTAEELLTKSVSEVVEILNDDITVEYNGSHSFFGSSTGSLCFYNFDILPGFVFSPKGVIYYPNETELNDVKSDILAGKYDTLSFIAVIDGANLCEEISADLTYNEISSITGNYATRPPAGQGLITQDLTVFCKNAANASVTYETSNEAMQHMSNDGYDVDFLKQENPKAMYMIAYKG